MTPCARRPRSSRSRRSCATATTDRPRPPALALVTVAGALVLLLAGCGGGGPSVSWRDLTLTLPDGWLVFEERDDLLSLADAPLGDEDGDRGDRAVAMQFSAEPTTLPDDWRTLVTDSGGTIESDVATEIDGAPATRLVYSWVTNGIPTREMVVLVPSRELVILAQPVPIQGQLDAPDVFLGAVDEFDAILTSIDFGAPARAP